LETKTFAELGLSPKVVAAVEAAGYSNPTPIQAQAIPVAVTGRDVLGIAQTGTGKTASFVLPMITRLETGRARARMPRSLILAPTRELAAQVSEAFEKYGTNHKLNMALLIGGVSFDDQLAKLDRGVDVLIATPGRLLDHFGRGKLMLMGVEILVIDEADRMLDMGFIPDIEKICKLLPPRRQTLFFSATMPPEITRLTQQFLKDPERVEVAPPATTAKTITQRFAFCRDSEDWAKRETLRQLLRAENVKNAIIFCNRKRDVAILHKSLSKHGFNAGALHGDMDQKARTETLDKFRSGEITLLAASDVAARGLDIPDVSHVFNFDMPWDADDYVHRIGRTGRAGKEGYSIGLVTPDDGKILKAVEKVAGSAPEWIGEPPTDGDFSEGGRRRRGGRTSSRPGADRGSSRRDSRGDRGSDRRFGGEAEREPRRERTERGPRSDRPRRDQRPHEAGLHDEGVIEIVGGHGGEQPGLAPERAERPRRPAQGERRAREERPDREPRQERPAPKQRREREAREPRLHAEPRLPEPRHAEPRQALEPRQHQERHQEPRREEPRRERQGAVGFADNVPAFLRNPVRPAKPAKVGT
jgi:superfamily II DNA/RNA helicase